MNTRLVKISLALCAAATVGGCTGVLAHKGAVVDPQLAASIQPGIDNKTSVEKLLGRHVHLQLFVKVVEDWRNKERELDEIGVTAARES